MKLQNLLEQQNYQRLALLDFQKEIIETDNFDCEIKSNNLVVITREGYTTRVEIDPIKLTTTNKSPIDTALYIFCIHAAYDAFKQNEIKVDKWSLVSPKLIGYRELKFRARKKLLSLNQYNISVQALLGQLVITGTLIGSTAIVFHGAYSSYPTSDTTHCFYPTPDMLFELVIDLINAI